MKIDHCGSCGAPIIWADTRHGRKMPVDAEPSPNGNVELRTVGGVVLATVGDAVLSLPGMAGTMHMSHFATCPHASEWRKGR
jgi:hypothetical protein